MESPGKLHNEDSVFCGEANDGQYGYLKIEVVVHPSQICASKGAYDAGGHGKQDGQWNRPAFVQRGEAEKNKNDGYGVQHGGLIGRGLFLIRLSCPCSVKTGRQTGCALIHFPHRLSGAFAL